MTQVSCDLHQLNVKTTSDNTNPAFFRIRATSCQRRQNPQNNNPQRRFPNQMIEQINIALEQKEGPGISQLGH